MSRGYQVSHHAGEGDATMICGGFGMRTEVYWEWKFERNPHGPGRIWVGDVEVRA